MKGKNIRRKIRYTSIYIALRILIFKSGLMPRSLWIKFFGFLGWMGYVFASHSRRLAIQHLTIAFGKELSQDQIRAMARKVFVLMGKNAGDIIRSFKIDNYDTFKKIRVLNGEQYARDAFARGKGVIFLTAHIGAFELFATEVAFLGMKPLIIGTPIKDKKLTELLWRQRSKLGAAAIERGKETLRLLKNLKSGGTIGILIDQDTRVQSVFVNFFGKPCATPIGAAVLALKTGAAVVPAFCHLRDDGLQEMNFYPPIELVVTGNEQQDIVVNTQRFTDVIEAEIRKHPEQWVWIHERWKTKPGEEISS